MSCECCQANTLNISSRVSPYPDEVNSFPEEVKSCVDSIVSKIEEEAYLHICSLQPTPPPYSPPPRLGIGRTSSGVTEEELVQAERREAPELSPPQTRSITNESVVRVLFEEDRTGDPSNLVEEDHPESEFQPDPQWVVSLRQGVIENAPECCSMCQFNIGCIMGREGVDDCCLWRHCGPEDDVDPEFVCTSCTFGGRYCSDCGVSENFYKACQQSRHHSLTGEWIPNIHEGFFRGRTQEDVCCPCCAVSSGLLDESEWPVYNGVGHIFNEDDEDGAYWESVYDEDGTYHGEYENEEPREDNTEKMKAVKEAVQDVGEFVFDLQDKLPEGDYLELMNLLQKVTNVANS